MQRCGSIIPSFTITVCIFVRKSSNSDSNSFLRFISLSRSSINRVLVSSKSDISFLYESCILVRYTFSIFRFVYLDDRYPVRSTAVAPIIAAQSVESMCINFYSISTNNYLFFLAGFSFSTFSQFFASKKNLSIALSSIPNSRGIITGFSSIVITCTNFVWSITSSVILRSS